MKDKDGELVMCTKRSDFYNQVRESSFLLTQKGKFWTHKSYNKMAECVLFLNVEFMERRKCEFNQNLLQLIPYITITNKSKNKLLTYTRGKSGGEDRLHNQHSIGFGGHINTVDRKDGRTLGTIYNAAIREVKEELGLELTVDDLELKGFIEAHTTMVERVHLGVLFTVELEDYELEKITAAESCIHGLRVEKMDDLAQTNAFFHLETWSKVALKNINNNTLSE